MDLDRLCAAVNPDRIRELTYALVSIPSPTRQARACTEFYAAHLRSLGLDVRLEFGHLPDYPSAVARLRGGDRPTVQFDGHTDHVPLDHPGPELLDDQIGRAHV